MLLGLFLRREWVTSIRSLRLFAHRRRSVMSVAVFVAVTFLVWDWRGLDRSSVTGASRFGLWLFGLVMAAQGCLALQLVITLAPAIAAERDRKSLDALLAARLTSAEIILGNLASGVIRYLNSMAATLPVVVLVVTLAGIDLAWVLLASASLASMSFSLAALSVAISAGSRTAARAVNVTSGIFAAWLTIPWLVVVFKPIVWPGGPNWIVGAALPLVDGSPMGFWTNLMGVMPRPGGVLGAFVRLIGWQVCAGLALIAWAIVRLRPASRAVHDVEGRTSRLRAIRAALRRPFPRPPCGDDPVLWNELYVLRGPSRLARLSGRALGLGFLVALAIGTSWFAGPAFAELADRGYSSSPEAFEMPEFNPFIRVLVSKMIIKSPLAPQPGQARLEFNIALRQFSAMLAIPFSFGIFAAVANGVTKERRRDTWLGLIATPLTGREILGAKMWGAVLNVRETAFVLISLWTVGLLAGAVHPLGYLTALMSLVACAGLASSMGLTGLTPNHSAEAIGQLRVLAGITASLLVMVVPPSLVFCAVLSFEDVRAAWQGGPFSQLGHPSIKDLVGARGVLAAWLVSLSAVVAGSIAVTRATFRDFDATIGRPVRPAPDRAPDVREVGLLTTPVEA